MNKFVKLLSLLLIPQLFVNAYAATCEYNIVDEWEGAFKAEVTITNNSQTLTDWSLSWRWEHDESFRNGWSANFNCEADTCSVSAPDWFSSLANGESLTFGFIANKNGGPTSVVSFIDGVCDNTQSAAEAWILNQDLSSLSYVSMKKEHTAETNSFSSLQGSVDENGMAVLEIDLLSVATGVDIRNTRLQALLFESTTLPKAWFNVQLPETFIKDMAVGSVLISTIYGELSLHAVTQNIESDVIITKLSEAAFSVSSISPVNISSQDFDMSMGIEALRVIANLSSIGESVPVYFHLHYQLQQDASGIIPPETPEAPSDLSANFDAVDAQSSLTWLDNSENETLYLVRRKSESTQWQTVAELESDATNLVEALPDTGEFDYKVIALNQGMPSDPSNIETVTVTQSNQLVRGQQLYQTSCAGCHGVNGEGIGGNPAINTERNVDDMIAYIRDFMPLGNPGSCDQQCAEDLSEYIQTLWVSEIACDTSLTPISYGARQLKILTRYEYQNSVEALTGIDYEVSNGLSEDAKLGFFRNNTFAAFVPTSYSNYLLVAEEIAQWSADQGFTSMLSCSAFDEACADKFVSDVAPLFFRRPLSESEIASYKAIADGSSTEGDIKAGIQLALEGLLSSPQFLYRHELGETNPANTQLDSDAFELTSYEMATFLAYTYTASTPDTELWEAANNDELRDPENILAHATRLASNSEAVMGQFVGSWLGTEDLETAAKDMSVWANFSALVPDLKNELNSTFSYVMLNKDEDFSALYRSDFSFINEALAAHYGIDGVSGTQLRKVDNIGRGGILANGAFMARWSESVESSPILRSVRVRRRMLCQEQPDPPAGTFAAREEKLAQLSALLQDPSTTNRTKYHRLTEDTPCTNCHMQYINPLGFGMEDFDSVGRIRQQDLNGNTINANGELHAPINYSDLDNVIPFNGSLELGNVLSELESAQQCLPKQMFRYVIGVGHQEIDPNNPEGTILSDEEKSSYACEVDKLTNTMLSESPRAMLEKFATLEAVRYRKAWSRDQ